MPAPSLPIHAYSRHIKHDRHLAVQIKSTEPRASQRKDGAPFGGKPAQSTRQARAFRSDPAVVRDVVRRPDTAVRLVNSDGSLGVVVAAADEDPRSVWRKVEGLRPCATSQRHTANADTLRDGLDHDFAKEIERNDVFVVCCKRGFDDGGLVKKYKGDARAGDVEDPHGVVACTRDDEPAVG